MPVTNAQFASGAASSAYGGGTNASGSLSSAFGSLSQATGDQSSAYGVLSNASGNFSFSNIPPGKYKLAAKAVIHNKTRKMEQDVTVEHPDQANPKPLRIVLK